ncbi:hypothetical protein JXL83_08645 [candidate division WOR-3 bacterium]|nr:hypothetical protein [candidate division WOR-3 bacterium]
MIKLNFNYKDIFRAGRLGFSFKKMSAAMIGLVILTVVYNVFSYASLMSAGGSLSRIWTFQRLAPIPFGLTLPWYSWLIWAVGALVSWLVLSITISAVSKITFEQLRGDEFYEVGKAYKDSLKLWKSSFLSPIILAVFIAFLFAVGALFGLMGKIPVAGPWLVGLLSVFLFLGAFFIVYLILVWIVSVYTSPTISVVTNGDSFDTLFEVFSVANEQTWRFVIWQLLVGGIMTAGVFIYSIAIKYTLFLFKTAMDIPSGQAWWYQTWNFARSMLPSIPPMIPTQIYNLFAKIFPGSVQVWTVSSLPGIGPMIGGIILAVLLYLVMLSILSLKLSIFSAGQTLIYVVLVKIKDDRNLLETKKKWSIDDEDEDMEDEEDKNEEETKDEDEKSGKEEEKNND